MSDVCLPRPRLLHNAKKRPTVPLLCSCQGKLVLTREEVSNKQEGLLISSYLKTQTTRSKALISQVPCVPPIKPITFSISIATAAETCPLWATASPPYYNKVTQHINPLDSQWFHDTKITHLLIPDL